MVVAEHGASGGLDVVVLVDLDHHSALEVLWTSLGFDHAHVEHAEVLDLRKRQMKRPVEALQVVLPQRHRPIRQVRPGGNFSKCCRDQRAVRRFLREHLDPLLVRLEQQRGFDRRLVVDRLQRQIGQCVLHAAGEAGVPDQEHVQGAVGAVFIGLPNLEVLDEARPDDLQLFLDLAFEGGPIGVVPLEARQVVTVDLEGFVELAEVSVMFGVVESLGFLEQVGDANEQEQRSAQIVGLRVEAGPQRSLRIVVLVQPSLDHRDGCRPLALGQRDDSAGITVQPQARFDRQVAATVRQIPSASGACLWVAVVVQQGQRRCDPGLPCQVAVVIAECADGADRCGFNKPVDGRRVLIRLGHSFVLRVDASCQGMIPRRTFTLISSSHRWR
jgi:hypothetical protein